MKRDKVLQYVSCICFVFIVPNPVTSLTSTTLSFSSLKLEWENPLGYQSYFQYEVQIVTENSSKQIVSENSASITGLNPGDMYNCSVTTTVSGDVQGQSVYVLGYTSEYFCMIGFETIPECIHFIVVRK